MNIEIITETYKPVFRDGEEWCWIIQVEDGGKIIRSHSSDRQANQEAAEKNAIAFLIALGVAPFKWKVKKDG